ncbi:MAG TPA: type IV pilus secretin PilQ [Burkholderiales bacterium]|nr:type IV pilus secretin PilQ [Burkholderiales bacterium]
MINLVVLFNRWLCLALGIMLCCSSYAADPAPGASGSESPAQNSIEAINVTALQGGSVAVRITLNQALANPPAGFSINNPPRIAFDFPDTANALGTNTQEFEKSGLRSINVVQAGRRTRLVMNLTQAFGYDTKIEGKDLVVTLQALAAGTTVAPVTTRFAEAKPSMTKHTVRDVDFRRGPNGEGRVIIDLSDSSTGIDLRQQGKNIVIDFIQTSLPSNLERRLDVVDFATPVQTIDAFSAGENVRIVVQPQGLWQQSAYQTDNRFTLELKQVVEEPSKLVQAGYTGEKLSLNFQNVEVRAVLQVIADFTGLNIVTSDTVTGNLTLRLKDVPWDQALDIILQAKGLDMRKTGNVVWIAPRDELATREKLLLESRQQISDLEPLHTESFQLNYQKTDAVQKLLTDPQQRILSKRGSVVGDARTNTLFVQDTAAKLEEVRSLIKKIDVAVRQVLIESRIVTATDNFSKNLGVKFGYQTQTPAGAFKGPGGLNTGLGGEVGTTASNAGQANATTINIPGALNVNLPATGISGAQPGALAVTIFNNAMTRFLNLELSALEADAKGKIISSPKVVTADQVEATISQGTQIPYQQATSSGATAVAFQNAVLSLKVKPQITPDDNVIMGLDVHNDSVGQNTTNGPAINTQAIQTQALVENGGTVVVGGIYIQNQQTTINKIPLLGDIPFLGVLFRSTATQDNRSELLIFITPKILKDVLTVR